MRKILAFDMDGVVCEGPYIPKDALSYLKYISLQPNVGVCEAIKKLSPEYEIIIITARYCENATRSVHDWLQMHMLSNHVHGVIANVKPELKPRIAELIGATMLFDDEPIAIKACGYTSVQGVLITNPHRNFDRVKFWKDNPSIRLADPEEGDIIKSVDDYYNKGVFSSLLESEPAPY